MVAILHIITVTISIAHINVHFEAAACSRQPRQLNGSAINNFLFAVPSGHKSIRQ